MSTSAHLTIAAGLAVSAGVMVTLQPALNGQLTVILGSPIKAAFISFSAGTLTLLLILLATRAQPPSGEVIAQIPWYLWIGGGMLGAFFVSAAAWSTPRVGVAVYLSILVAAQLTAALAFDHFGLAGLTERAITWPRAAGAALLIAGAVLVTRG